MATLSVPVHVERMGTRSGLIRARLRGTRSCPLAMWGGGGGGGGLNAVLLSLFTDGAWVLCVGVEGVYIN